MSILVLILAILEIFIMLVISVVSIVFLYFMVNSKLMRHAPPVPSCGKVKTEMMHDVSKILSKRKNQVVMDLGSGWGSLLIPLAKEFPNHHFIGIEHGYIPYFVSKIRSKNIPNLTFIRENFFKSDISKAHIIFMFLLPHIMPKISAKCRKECSKGTLLYINRFQIPNFKPQRKVSLGTEYDSYYVYKIGD